MHYYDESFILHDKPIKQMCCCCSYEFESNFEWKNCYGCNKPLHKPTCDRCVDYHAKERDKGKIVFDKTCTVLMAELERGCYYCNDCEEKIREEGVDKWIARQQ